jgi:hypothetical protein
VPFSPGLISLHTTTNINNESLSRMGSWFDAVRQPHHAPLSSLIVLFVGWKLLLLTIAFSSPGFGYDTSTRILLQSRGLPLSDTHATSVSERFALKLVRWDAIYYTTTAARGYTFEQEWAFGWGLTRLLAFLAESKFFGLPLTLHLHVPAPRTCPCLQEACGAQ